MRFSYASPARLADIPCLDAASLRAAILTQVAHGWRVLAFFGLPRALYAQGELALVAGNTAAAGLCCVMAHDQRQELWASRCPAAGTLCVHEPGMPAAPALRA